MNSLRGSICTSGRGRSINDYGIRGRAISNINFDTQAKVDAYSEPIG